jgi:hypothetical protein
MIDIFGGTAGIAEMLPQSHNNSIHYCPVQATEYDTGETLQD